MPTIITMYMNKYMQVHAGIYTTSSDTTHGNHNMHIIQRKQAVHADEITITGTVKLLPGIICSL